MTKRETVRSLEPTKRDRLDALLADRGLAAVWFAEPNSFAWLTGGSNVVDRHAPVGVAAVGYDGVDVHLVTDNIEAPRLAAEEVADDVRITTFEWYDGSLAEAVAEHSPQPMAADFDVPDAERVDGGVLRQPLTDADVAEYRTLGEASARAVEAVCRDLTPETTEREAAAQLQRRLAERGIDAPVALVGGSERAPLYRHYTPTDATVGTYALVSVTAERGGLYASLTRTVAFDPPAWLDERHRGAMRVEATALAATREAGLNDGTAGNVFDAVRAAYDAVGYPDEWREHHQGGAAGFAGREWFGSPGSTTPVSLPMGYAWNPTIQGAKSEGTALVTESGVEPLTATDEWPTTTVEAVGHDLTTSLPAVLERDA